MVTAGYTVKLPCTTERFRPITRHRHRMWECYCDGWRCGVWRCNKCLCDREYATVGHNAIVVGAAIVAGNAFIADHAMVMGNAVVSGSTLVCEQAVVVGDTVYDGDEIVEN